MALWNRQKKVDVPAELQPYYAGDSPAGGRSWLLWAARIVAILIIIFLIILVVRWVWHENHTGGKKPTTPGITQQHKPAPKTGTNNGPVEQGSGGANTNSSPNGQQTQPGGSSGSQPPSSSSPSTSSGQSLTNTGPGETVALFFASAVVGAALYQYRLRHKLQKF